VAQLGARFHGMEEVVGSNPTRSTKTPTMVSVYILQSLTTGRFYIGCCTNVEARLAEHQRGQTISTRGRGPWILVYQEQFDTLSEALGRERQLKSWKSHRSIQELISNSRSGERAPA
jgi:putative endonuclease